MTTHVFEGRPIITYGDMGDLVAEIARSGDRDRAQRFLQSYRDFCVADGDKAQTADINIGYWTGYFDHDLAAKARELFGVQHPIFGDAATTEEALQSGFALGRGEDPRQTVDETEAT